MAKRVTCNATKARALPAYSAPTVYALSLLCVVKLLHIKLFTVLLTLGTHGSALDDSQALGSGWQTTFWSSCTSGLPMLLMLGEDERLSHWSAIWGRHTLQALGSFHGWTVTVESYRLVNYSLIWSFCALLPNSELLSLRSIQI